MQSPGWQPTFMCGLIPDLVISNFIKNMVIHDTECPYWDQVSLNNTKPNHYYYYYYHYHYHYHYYYYYDDDDDDDDDDADEFQ